MPRLALMSLCLLGTSAFAATPTAAHDTAPTAADRAQRAPAEPITTTAAGRGGGGTDRGGANPAPDPEPETVGGGRGDDGPKKGGKKGDGKGDGQKGDRKDPDRERDGRKGDGGRRKGAFTIERLNPLHGTLVYGPKPSTHHKYQNAGDRKRPTVVPKRDLPERSVDRKGSLAAGLRAGTMVHGYDDGSSHSDLGIGLMGRYRVFEAFGLEVGVSRHADALFGAERGQTLLSGSGEIFLFPWSRMSPYALVGVTSNSRNQVPGMSEPTSLLGPHAGIGLELALGKSLAIDLEGRAIGWSNPGPEETANPVALTATGGLTFHF